MRYINGEAAPQACPHLTPTPLLKATGIEKSFGAIRTLLGVDLTLHRGEVLGLLGDNGAGKSTLMKVLSGAVIPDRGQLSLNGEIVQFRSPQDARARGVEMVYQDLSLCDSLNVAANVFLGREPLYRVLGVPFLDHRALHHQAAGMLQELHVSVASTRIPVRQLSGGQRQAIAIARAVAFGPKLLILDEPTAALAVREVEEVLALIRRLSASGVGIILISHRLQDVMLVTHRIAVMYEGRKVAERVTAETTLEEVIRLIVQA